MDLGSLLGRLDGDAIELATRNRGARNQLRESGAEARGILAT